MKKTKEEILRPFKDDMYVHFNEALSCMDIYKDQELADLQAKFDKLKGAFKRVLELYVNESPNDDDEDKKNRELVRSEWLKEAGLIEEIQIRTIEEI